MQKQQRFVWVGLFLLTQIFTFTYRACAQSIRRPTRIITTKDGLPQSFVSGLTQDSAGFVWIGTRNGLARYDGRQFLPFHYKQLDSTSLSSDVIISMLKDNHNQVWIEHESGEIDKLSPSTQRIERISRRPLFQKHPLVFARQGWVIDTKGNLWGTKLQEGLWGYDWSHKTLRHFTKQSRQLPSDTIRGLMSSRQGLLWLISPDDLIQLNPTTGKFRSIPLPIPIRADKIPSVAGGTVQLQERKNGDIMWTYGGQLFVFSAATNRFQTVPFPDTTYVGQCWLYTTPAGQSYLAANNQVYQYDPARGLVIVGQLSGNHLDPKSLLVDQSNVIWVGTNAAGIHQVDPSGPYFESQPYKFGFHEDVFRQEFGVSLLTSLDWSSTDKNVSGASYSIRSTYDAQNRLWIALHYQIGYYDPTQRRLILLPSFPSHPTTTKRPWRMGGIRFDPTGTLWAADGNGYVAFFDKQQQRWIPWLTDDQFKEIVGFKGFTVDLFVDNQAVWLTTRDHGLVWIDRTTRRVQLVTHATPQTRLPTNMLLGFQPDPLQPNRLWLGSHEGLIALDKRTLQNRVFTTADGLPDNTIYSIISDKAGFLWVSTNHGLCRFDPRTFQVRTFSSTDGLPGDEFNRFHHLRLPDGRLAFGSTEGWTLFDPKTVQDDPFQPPVVLTNLMINNVQVPVTPGYGPLPVPINELQQLSAPSAQNMISLDFAGLEYSQPLRLQYRYQLIDYDETWVQAGHFPQATYTHLPSGQYTLRVNATNTTGQWSKHVHTLAITITPPWWRSWWAYLVYGLVALVLLRIYSRLRMQQAREQQERINQQKEAEQLRELNELKNRFFANITHELQTPLTLIMGPIQSLQAVIQEPAWQKWLGIIDQNTYKLLNLINQLLDLSRLEAGVVSIEERQGDLSDFVNKLVESVRPEAEMKGLQLSFNNQLDATQYWFDADKLERIGLNLLTNAVKFTQQGQLTVTLQPSQSGICLLIEDTGIGISASEREHIFDRFHQTSSVDKRNGSGIGLALVNELVTLQGGTIHVESQPSSTISTDQSAVDFKPDEVQSGRTQSGQTQSGWTRFTVKLPYRLAEQATPAYLTRSEERLSQPFPDEKSDEQPLVLIVEDNVELSNFIAESLPEHYRIQQAADGIEGLEAAIENGPELIISDVIMPRMDGYLLCQQLKQDLRTSHIPVILLTAKVTLEDQLQGLTYGADEYLTKPFYVKELQLRVQNLIDRQRRQRAWLQSQFTRSTETNVLSLTQKTAAGLEPSSEGLSASFTSANNPFLEELHVLLANHFNDARFGVEELAAHMNLSRVHLYRKIKALSGLTATELLRNYRLKQATHFLREGMSVTETAYAVGFESPAYFTKCFRDLYGVTPSDFFV